MGRRTAIADGAARLEPRGRFQTSESRREGRPSSRCLRQVRLPAGHWLTAVGGGGAPDQPLSQPHISKNRTPHASMKTTRGRADQTTVERSADSRDRPEPRWRAEASRIDGRRTAERLPLAAREAKKEDVLESWRVAPPASRYISVNEIVFDPAGAMRRIVYVLASSKVRTRSRASPRR